MNIKRMVDRFLQWPLPDTFNPDGGISFTRSPYYTPVGTNLFSAAEAEQMVRHMVAEEAAVAPTLKVQTIGQYRVGLDFNPSNNLQVQRIKEKAAALIDEIDSIQCGDHFDPSEVIRLKILAMDGVESAAMWGVKAATKPERK